VGGKLALEMQNSYKLKDFLLPIDKSEIPIDYDNIGAFYKYTLYMAPQFVMLSQLKDKLVKHYKEFALARLEFHLAPFFIDTKGNLYYQLAIDIDAKVGKLICLKKQPVQIVNQVLLRELPALTKRMVHIELTSFTGLHIIADRLFYVDILKLAEVAQEINMLAEFTGFASAKEFLQYVKASRANFSINWSASELFRYLKPAKQLVRRLVLLKLQAFKCVDPAGMNHNPFRRFPSRANIPNKKLWVTPLTYNEFEKLSVTELHLKLQQFKIESLTQFAKLVDKFLYPIL